MKELFTRYESLKGLENEINLAVNLIVSCYKLGGKIMLIGNGGSAADCGHIASELLKNFYIKRPIDNEFYNKLSSVSENAKNTAKALQKGIACVDLTAFTPTLTAIGNDTGYEYAFSQTFYSLYKPNDVLIAFTTSGRSQNIINMLEVAKALNAKTITFTGKNRLICDDLSTVTLAVNEVETYKIQELHLPIYHYICKEVERILFGN